MVKNSVVKEVQANGTWEGQYGLMYKFEVTFDNGDCGQCLCKTDSCKFVVGENASYEYTGGKYPKVKYVSDFQKGGNAPKQDVQEYIIRQSSLKCATDYVIANGGNITTIIHNADIFANWVLTGKVPATKAENESLPF